MTAYEPSWDEILRLAAIAAIRTALNNFLHREIAHEATRKVVLAGPPLVPDRAARPAPVD